MKILIISAFFIYLSSTSAQTLEVSFSQKQSGIRIDPKDCQTVVENTLELRMNGSTDAQLNTLLQVISGECGLTEKIANINIKPVFFKFAQSEFKILWTGSRFYFNERAQATVDMAMAANFQNVVIITAEQVISNTLSASVETAKKTELSDRNKLGLFDRLVFEISGIQQRLKFIEREGQLRLQVSGYAYHDRGTYDREKIKALNERAWGIGIERLLYINENKRESINALWITDSHSDPQFSFAYEWQKRFFQKGAFEIWAGLSAGIVLRSDFDYSPIPFVLPTVAFSYGKVTLKFVAIPSVGGVNNGNVLFGLISVGI